MKIPRQLAPTVGPRRMVFSSWRDLSSGIEKITVDRMKKSGHETIVQNNTAQRQQWVGIGLLPSSSDPSKPTGNLTTYDRAIEGTHQLFSTIAVCSIYDRGKGVPSFDNMVIIISEE